MVWIAARVYRLSPFGHPRRRAAILTKGRPPLSQPLGKVGECPRSPADTVKKEKAMREANVTIQTIARFLEQRQWRYDVCGTDRIMTGFGGKQATFPISILLPEDEPYRLMLIVRIAPVVPEERRTQMAEALARANYGLKVGCFQMDMGTGTLSFVAIMPLADGTITAEQFDAVLEGAMCYTDAYFRAFARLLYADDLSPAEVIAEVEMAK